MKPYTYRQHVGPSITERLARVLPTSPAGADYRTLPDGTEVLIGVEWVYTSSDAEPKPCETDLGGDKPFVLWGRHQFHKSV